MIHSVEEPPAAAPAPRPPAAAPTAVAVSCGLAPGMHRAYSFLRRWAWLPVLLLPLALLVLKAVHCPGSLDLPYLRAALSLVFGTLIGLGVVLLVGRSFLLRGQPGLLLLACGLLLVALSGIVATVVGGQDVNLNVTIFNLCAWLAAVCHLLGVLLLMRRWRPLLVPGLWLWLGSLLVLLAVGLVALVARAGWLPLFFIQNQGGTAVRQVILGSAVTLFALSALLPRAASRQPLSTFLYWYSLALGLNAAGLLGAMLQPAFGSPISWLAWATLCLGGVYMLFAALASVRESRAWGTALEVALHESEERFQALTQASFEGIVMAEAGRITDCNEQFLQMLSYRREEVVGQEIALFVLPEDLGRILANIVQNREACHEHAMLRKDGTRILVEAHGKPLAYEGRQVRVVAIRDITERKLAEQALEAAQAKLQAHARELEQVVAQRTAKLHEAVAELEHFSYAITHDMRAPLRAMQGYADMLDQRCGECCQPLNQEFFRRIKIAAGRMDQLITDSLNYSKAIRQEVALEPVNLRELLEGMIHTYPNLLPDQADIRLEPGLPTVMGNQAALTQCFGNLLGNAVKFAKPNTKPQIRVWAQRVQSAECKVQSGTNELQSAPSCPIETQKSKIKIPTVRVWVEDNGIGIPEEMRERIFGLFERAHTQLEGTGLGLAIVRKFARRMGGEVGVESAPGQGSRFWVELELAPGKEPLAFSEKTPG